MAKMHTVIDDVFVDAIKRYQAGETEAFDHIYENTVTQLTRYAYYLTGDPGDAEDLVQETYLRILENINGIREYMAFIIWSKSIMHNLFVNRCRKRMNEFVCDDDALISLLDKASVSDDPEALAMRKETERAVDDAVLALPEMQQDAVRKFYYEMRTVKWISNHDHAGINTVKTRLFYARKSLARSFGEMRELI